jgi:hypothetical protein
MTKTRKNCMATPNCTSVKTKEPKKQTQKHIEHTKQNTTQNKATPLYKLPDIIGFKNYYTNLTTALCTACLEIVTITNHLSPLTPIPTDCTCRAIPPIYLPLVKPITPTPDTTDTPTHHLMKHEPNNWSSKDWNTLVFKPIRIGHAINSTGILLPLIAMIPKILHTKHIKIPKDIKHILLVRGYGSDILDLLTIFHHDLWNTNRIFDHRLDEKTKHAIQEKVRQRTLINISHPQSTDP